MRASAIGHRPSLGARAVLAPAPRLLDGGPAQGSGGGSTGDGNELYSFYPPTLALKKIGIIGCPSGGATPFSMAVDRAGTAWGTRYPPS